MKTNKLDEILAEFEDDVYTFLSAKQAIYNIDLIKSRKKAKQAIIELIEGEIIGENENEYLSTTHYNEDTEIKEIVLRNRNILREFQKQKLQKLKE